MTSLTHKRNVLKCFPTKYPKLTMYDFLTRHAFKFQIIENCIIKILDATCFYSCIIVCEMSHRAKYNPIFKTSDIVMQCNLILKKNLEYPRSLGTKHDKSFCCKYLIIFGLPDLYIDWDMSLHYTFFFQIRLCVYNTIKHEWANAPPEIHSTW